MVSATRAIRCPDVSVPALSPSARAMAWIADLWIPALWLAVSLPVVGFTWAQGGAITLLRETVDVPAQVLRAVPVSESVGKGVR